MSQQSPTIAKPDPRITALLILVAVLVAIAAFRGTLSELVGRWMRQEEYSHGFLIPVISAWLLWTRRDALAASLGAPSWTGPALVALAALMHVFGELSALFVLSQLGFLVALMGIVLGAGGFSLLKLTFIPIVFLGFAIPLPYFVDSDLSWRLQIVSSQLGVAVIRLFQIPVFLEGNVIDLGAYKLQVVEACSGLRYLYPLMSLGFLAAYLFQAPLWQRALLFLSTIPITIAMNSLRIGIVGIMVENFGPQEADGALHLFEGWIIFIACALLLLLEVYLLVRLSSRRSLFDVFHPPHIAPSAAPAAQGRAARAPLFASLALVALAGVSALFVTGRQELVPERMSFASFPRDVGEWRGRTSSLERQTEHFLGLTDYVLSDYAGRDGRQVNLYVAYYASQRKGVSPHSPSVCIPGNGWQITDFARTRLEGAGVSLPYNRVVIGKDSTKQLVYYWFEQRGRKIENEWWSKWYLISDAIVRNRTDGALVRLTTPVYPTESEADADRRLQAFTRDLMPALTGYLPADETIKSTSIPLTPAKAGVNLSVFAGRNQTPPHPEEGAQRPSRRMAAGAVRE
jgi:exosortase D (VPLPA-CTERM-specific)